MSNIVYRPVLILLCLSKKKKICKNRCDRKKTKKIIEHALIKIKIKNHNSEFKTNTQ